MLRTQLGYCCHGTTPQRRECWSLWEVDAVFVLSKPQPHHRVIAFPDRKKISPMGARVIKEKIET